MRRRRGLAQDTGTDPFEDMMGIWDGIDEIADDFTWATCAPATGSPHHVRPKWRPRRTRR